MTLTAFDAAFARRKPGWSSTLIVWSGLRIAARAVDDAYPFGYGKAEPLAAVVSLMLLGAAVGIAVKAVQEIVTPHHAPARYCPA